MEKTLDLFTIGESGIVKSVIAEGKIKRRLFDMGITPGAEITVRGYELTLRKTEALCVKMEVTK